MTESPHNPTSDDLRVPGGAFAEGLENLPAWVKGCVLTIGNFDGVHLGHQRIIRTARALAHKGRAHVAALTFEPPAHELLHPETAPRRITPPPHKQHLLAEAGADLVVTLQATRELLGMPAEAFVDGVIVGAFGASAVVEGPSFFFGRGRGGDVDLLARLGPERGFETHVVEPFMLDADGVRQRVSSTLVRRYVAEGRVEEARGCLGRDFTLWGPVVSGRRQGRLLSYPTANIDPGRQVLPAEGVYAGRAVVDGQMYVAALSVGTNPTFGPTEVTVEAFLLDARGDFYGREMSLSFVQRLRAQRKFPDAESLREQIIQDVNRVREICR